MGAIRLEARLRTRLAIVLVPLLTAVGVAAVAVTAHALDAADDTRARSVAYAVALTVRAELAEGDSFADAAHESVAPYDARDVQIFVGVKGPATGLPTELAGVTSDRCDALSRGGVPWRACAARLDDLHVTVAVRTEAHRAVVRTLAQWMLAVLALALLGTFVALRFSLRSPLRSLVRLAEWADGAAATELASPPTGGTVEIDILSAAFDRLVKQLLDVLSRERANSAHIAHELRTPLTAITAELAAMPSTGADAVARVRSDAARLTRVIDAILLLSGPPQSKRGDSVVNVADVARKLAPPGAALTAPDEALVEADPHLVELAIVNLLENATKYAAAGARAVKVTREADLVRVSVVDDGPAPDAAAREQMFDRYWREAGSGAGSGLGLALVRAVARRHGGEATARDADRAPGLDVGFTMGPLLEWHDAPPTDEVSSAGIR